MTFSRFWTPLFLLIFLLSACQEGAVVFAPTPLPPDLSPLPYHHASGAFSIRVPRDWAVYEQHTANFAGVAFTPPDASIPVLTLGVINLNSPVETLSLINQYQTTIRPDARTYEEQDRQAMGDGSWRLVGVRHLPSGGQAVNTFFQRNEDTIAVMEIHITEETFRLNQLEVAVNTFTVNPNNSLESTSINTLALMSTADVRVMNINAWLTPQDVYYVTGEIANFGTQPLTNITVNVALLDDAGNEVVGALDSVMGYALESGEYAPFSLRFGSGKPSEANRFAVTLSEGEFASRGVDTTGLSWVDQSTQTAEGHLLIAGVVTNDSFQTLYDPLAVVTVFDTMGRVIAAGYTQIAEGAFPAGESATFSLRIQELGGAPANYIVNLQAYE